MYTLIYAIKMESQIDCVRIIPVDGTEAKDLQVHYCLEFMTEL